MRCHFLANRHKDPSWGSFTLIELIIKVVVLLAYSLCPHRTCPLLSVKARKKALRFRARQRQGHQLCSIAQR